MHVADDADDLPLLRVAVILIRADIGNALAYGVFVREISSRERFVDDGSADAARLILICEVAPVTQRNPDRLKVLRSDAAHVGHGSLPRLRLGAAFDPEIAAHVAAAERHGGYERGALDAGQRFKSFERLIDVAHTL